MSGRRGLLSRLVTAIDRRERRRLGVWEFSDDPGCILRLGLAKTRTGAVLSDGTVVQPGETVGIIHFWNERMPQIPATGADLAWARKMRRALVYSFQLMAHYLAEEPGLPHFQAFGGELPFIFTPATVRLLHRLGLETFEPIPPNGPKERIIDAGARLWTWLLRRSFNPESARGLRLSDLQRRPTWISKRRLLALYGPGPQTGEPAQPMEEQIG